VRSKWAGRYRGAWWGVYSGRQASHAFEQFLDREVYAWRRGMFGIGVAREE
jgi:hypothetical protein